MEEWSIEMMEFKIVHCPLFVVELQNPEGLVPLGNGRIVATWTLHLQKDKSI